MSSGVLQKTSKWRKGEAPVENYNPEEELGKGQLVAIFREQADRELLFFEAELEDATMHLGRAKDEEEFGEWQKYIANLKKAHLRRMAALEKAQADYGFGFQLDKVLMTTNKALSVVLQNIVVGDSDFIIPKEDVDNAPPTHVRIEEEGYAFKVGHADPEKYL